MTAARRLLRGARSSVARGVLALAMCGGLVTLAWPAPRPELSDEQQRSLAAGEVIVRDALPPGASATARGGTAVALVRASPEQVWRVLVDYPGHVRYYPKVVAAEVVERDERRVVVRYRVGLGPFSFNFHMDKYPDPRHRRIEWHLADAYSHGLFRENSGYWQVDEAGRASLVTYAIAVRTVLPAFVTGGAERDSLVETIVAMRRVAEEGSGAAPRTP
jgi:ribosome-associated toxin RatA of RatAB toxin-antitoxin module